MSKKIAVILLDNVRGYGNRGSVIEVSPAYANNVLIKQGKAKLADASTLNNIKQLEEKKVRDHEKSLAHVHEMLADLESSGGIQMKVSTTEMNHLYAKIDAKDIVKELMLKYKFKLPETALKLKTKIEQVGDYEIDFDYEKIKAKIKVKVLKK